MKRQSINKLSVCTALPVILATLEVGCACAQTPSGPLAQSPALQSSVPLGFKSAMNGADGQGMLFVLTQAQNGFANIARSAEPFVVNITASRPINDDTDSDSDPDSQAHKQQGSGAAPAFPRFEEATGSGMIVRPDGYILTNDHVVEGSEYVTVTLSDGRDFQGKVIPDFHSDLALVKIDTGGAALPTATFDTSDDLEPGQWAIAIGSPFDLQNTMTVGVISALHREQTIGDDAESRYYPDLIQTDAPINPGNSGGPLLNIAGQVVGVNVAIDSPVDGSSGIGFAIPASTATYVVNQLIEHGKVVRGYLGVDPADITPARAAEFGVAKGAWIKLVVEDSPAGHAGLHATDIVTAYNGRPISGGVALRTAIAETAPETPVTLTVVRNGQPVAVSVTVAAPPLSDDDNAPPLAPTRQVGLTYKVITASIREEMGLLPGTNGVIITDVAPNSPADDAGLSQNDIIEQIGHKRIASVEDATAGFDALQPGQSTTVVILHKDSEGTDEEAIDLRI